MNLWLIRTIHFSFFFVFMTLYTVLLFLLFHFILLIRQIIRHFLFIFRNFSTHYPKIELQRFLHQLTILAKNPLTCS